jgi:hypothetical protein
MGSLLDLPADHRATGRDRGDVGQVDPVGVAGGESHRADIIRVEGKSYRSKEARERRATSGDTATRQSEQNNADGLNADE